MSDLREAVERLPDCRMTAICSAHRGHVDPAAVLALIPENAVLVTQDELAEALRAELKPWNPYVSWDEVYREWAGRILARLRSRPSPTEEKG